ncbi:hypothetical protein JCM11641_007104 [Rhodosporidiobolus odoratus]
MSNQPPQVSEGHPPDRFDKIKYSDLNNEEPTPPNAPSTDTLLFPPPAPLALVCRTDSEWTRLGKGSFGCVYKGEYLGIEVAIKEVLPSGEYDVEKYLQREITLMQQARHPNIVQYLGLCLAPASPHEAPATSSTASHPRILIISEFLPRGNLRQYILDRTLPFPWRLRLSFATDIARALAYLHARATMHRDLKGENCLITSNERLKMCDFGLARVAPGGGKEDEAWRRLTYCGTDGYMSPEILLGQPFTLSTDIFSLGILLLEIASRSLASNHTFVRQPPFYGVSTEEAWSSISPLCPKEFVELALNCCDTDPDRRPDTREILRQLAAIEVQVLEADAAGTGIGEEDAHARGRSVRLLRKQASLVGNVGSISYAGTTKKGSYGALVSASRRRGARGGTTGGRPGAPRLPSFEGKVNMRIGSSFIASAASSSTAAGVGLGAAAGGAAGKGERKVTPVPGYEGPGGHAQHSSEDDDDEALLALVDAEISIDEAELQLQLDMGMRPDSAHFDRMQQRGHPRGGGAKGEEEEDGEGYSTGVIKPSTAAASSFLTNGSTKRGGNGAGARPYGRLGSKSGSTFASGSLPSLPPSWIAASREASEDDGTATVIATTSPAGTPIKPRQAAAVTPAHWEDCLTARTSTLSVAQAVVECAADDEERDVFVSTMQSPPRTVVEEVPEADEVEEEVEEEEEVGLPHRFSLVKPGLHRLFASLSPSISAPAQLSSYAAGLPTSPSSGRLSFQLLGRTESGMIDPSASSSSRSAGPHSVMVREKELNREGRCGFCEKKFGIMKAYLCCDDCGLATHIRCSDSIPPFCPATATPVPATTPLRTPAPASPTLPQPAKPTRAPPAAPSHSHNSTPLASVDTNARPGSRERVSKLVKKKTKRPGSVSSRGSSQGGMV